MSTRVLLAVLVALAPFLLVPRVCADEGDSAATRARVAEIAVEALLTRIEALIREGDLLLQAGRSGEALMIYSSIGEVYELGMESVGELVAQLSGDVRRRTPYPGGAFKKRRADRRPSDDRARRFDRAVEGALTWLAAQQSPSGAWVPTDGGHASHTPRVTGLAVCAFLGAGYTNLGRHPYASVVSRGLAYLKSIQDDEGRFRSPQKPRRVANHAAGALAMVEAYGMTGSRLYHASAQQALNYISHSRVPGRAWSYRGKPDNRDVARSASMMLVLRSARTINSDARARGLSPPLQIDSTVSDDVAAWIEDLTDPEQGRVGYLARLAPSIWCPGSAGPAGFLVDAEPETPTAAGVLIRILLGENPQTSAPVALGAARLTRLPPTRPGLRLPLTEFKHPGWIGRITEPLLRVDMDYWYYGSLALRQVGGKSWRVWERGLMEVVVDQQLTDGDRSQDKGSWNPLGLRPAGGGRVGATATLALCLEGAYRYDPARGRR